MLIGHEHSRVRGNSRLDRVRIRGHPGGALEICRDLANVLVCRRERRARGRAFWQLLEPLDQVEHALKIFGEATRRARLVIFLANRHDQLTKEIMLILGAAEAAESKHRQRSAGADDLPIATVEHVRLHRVVAKHVLDAVAVAAVAWKQTAHAVGARSTHATHRVADTLDVHLAHALGVGRELDDTRVGARLHRADLRHDQLLEARDDAIDQLLIHGDMLQE